MSHIAREHQYRVKYYLDHGREPTAREVASALHIQVARQETISLAVRALMASRPIAVEHTYNLSSWKEDNQRCLAKLLQLQR